MQSVLFPPLLGLSKLTFVLEKPSCDLKLHLKSDARGFPAVHSYPHLNIYSADFFTLDKRHPFKEFLWYLPHLTSLIESSPQGQLSGNFALCQLIHTHTLLLTFNKIPHSLCEYMVNRCYGIFFTHYQSSLKTAVK